MAEIAFDTQKAADDLRDAGADDRLARAIVRVAHNATTGGAATRADLAELELGLLKHVYGVAAACTGIVVVANKWL